MSREKETFSYTYSAKEQAEIRAIRKKYAPAEEESPLQRIRRLDASVGNKARAIALTLGVIGALILGFGMSLALSELADFFGLTREMGMLIGIPVALPGIALICLAYPVYNRVLQKEKARVAPEILRLTEEWMK